MAPILDWKKLMRVDPDALPSQEELADRLLETVSKVDGKNLKNETPEQLIHLFKITQSLMKMKAQEVELALEEVEKAGEEQAKCENLFKTKVMKLENELEIAQRSAGGRDTRFLRDEIRQLEKQVEQKERQLTEIEKELEKEKKVNEQLALRNEDTENENIKLRRENEQLRQDVIDYQRQIDSQKETVLSRRGDYSDYRSQLSKKNFELVQYLDEIQNLTETNEKLDIQNQEMRKNLEESVQEMEKMTDEYNKMKLIVQQSDTVMDQLRKEKEQYKFQVQELSDQLKAKNEEDDPLMAAVNAKVEEWKKILASKDDELIEYQQMLFNMKEEIKMARLDVDRNSILALQQGVQERDAQIRLLTEQVEQYTKEMEQNAFLIEELKNDLQKDKGLSTLAQQNRLGEMQEKLNLLEERTKEAEKSAELAEADAKEKDKELVEALKRMKDYELGIYGLEEAVAEIKDLKKQIKIRDHEIETLIKEANKLELKINDFLDENEELRERLGLEPKTMIDLSEFRNSKVLKQQQYRAENHILLKEIEMLEEERIELKKQVRKLAQEKGRVATNALDTADMQITDSFTEEKWMNKRKLDFLDTHDIVEVKAQNEYLAKELSERERDLEKNRTVIVTFQSKLKELSEENKQLEQGMKEILQAVKEMQNDPSVKGGETALTIPSLDRLVNAIESKNTEGIFDASVHLKAQVDQLTGRNEELRQELKESQKEATSFSNQLANANEKITQLKNEICLLRQSEGANIVFKTVNLPEGMAPSSVNMINSLNEYLIRLIQELENKEQLLKQLEDSVKDFKRKFAVIRHQQGLLYKEYQSEKESWQKESEKMKEEKKKLEEQKEQDAAKIKEYSNLLSALQLDPDETKKLLAENNRKITVLRVNERSLTRQYTTLLEMERHLRKENEKLKSEMTHMETAVIGKIGHLQRFKEMASFKIAALQKVLDGSVPLSELELANKQYNALTAKYRDMLQKDNLLVQRTTNMEHMERENESLKAQINLLNKELEITKEKLHTIEQAWEQVTKLGDDNAMDKASKAITNSEILSISKKIATLEMKELNERQRAEHSQRMYEHLRNTLKQVEERNFELETKFAELTKINLEAQKVEQELRDELSNSVSKAVSDADRRQIMDLEKREMELKTEVSKLRELSDVANMQVEALEARQQCREKEVESLRMQVLDCQAQSDEKTVIAKLHQHIIALQGSESIAVGKLETLKLKLQKMEIHNLRLEQKLDEKEQALYFARLEGRNRAKHLRQTVQSLRRQFSGALPLIQQEKFSKTMIQLQNDKLKILEEVQHAQQERRNAENRALEVELKLKSLEELLLALKDTRGAQKVIEWHLKMEELHLQGLKLNRELLKQKEEIKYLHNIISEYECTINNLEEEIVQQNKLHEERQMAWDQREVELQRQLDVYDHQQNEILSTALKLEEATGSVPDPNLPLPQQLELALRKIREHIRIIVETRATCKSLEEKLKEKETALWKAEQNILSRDKVINELRLRLPATSEREKIIAELGKKEDDPEYHHAIKIAHQTIANMQARLNQKEEVLKKYQHLLAKAREEQEEIAKKHEEDLRVLHQKLELCTDNSLNKFKQTALELMEKPSSLPSSKHFLRLAEMEQTVVEQDNSLASLVGKLKKTSSDLEKQKQITLMKIKEFETIRAQLQKKHTVDVEQLKDEANGLKNLVSQMEKELANVKAELEVQKEANNRAPTATLKNLVEQLKSQLGMKEKQQKALSKALLELRAEMTANAEQQIISAASQKEAYMNVQEIVDRETKGLMAQIEELNNQISKLTDNLKISKNRESALLDEKEELNQELQKKQKTFTKVMREKNEIEKENEELKKRIRRLTSSIQNKADEQNLTDVLQKKVKKLENELEKKYEETERKSVRRQEDKTSKEEIIRWEESKKWQMRTEGMRNKLKEKEKEMDTVLKQFSTLKELYTKAEKEKITLQKKLKTTGVTVDRVVGVRASETEKELEELRKRNLDLENEVAHMRTQQAIPRDSVVEELHLKNQYLQEKLHALQRQYSRESYSRPSSCYQTELTNSVPVSISKQEYLNYLQKKPISNRDEIKHQTNLRITGGNEIGEEAGIQTCIMRNEGCEATKNASAEVFSEQHPEDNEQCKDTDICWEQLKAEENHSDKEENITQPENVKNNEESEEQERKQETCKQSNVDEEKSVEEPYADRMSCNQSDSGEPSNQANNYEAGKINVNNEMNQHTPENKCETYRSGTEGVVITPELCEMPETSGVGSNDQYRREDVLKENLRLSSENVELRFQLEQANRDLPRLKDQVGDLKEMCELLKKEKADLERKLGNVRGAGRSGKTIPELEKTIGLMKKVVERVQRENEDLKKTPAVVSNVKLLGLEQENEKLKSEMEKMKLHLGGQLSMHYESKTKGMEKVITENERLRKELKKEADSGEKLRIAKNNLEILNEKLTIQLEEAIKRLNLAENTGPQLDEADRKSCKSVVVTRMQETKLKELEMDIAKKTEIITNLKQLLQEAIEREHNADKNLKDLKEQIELLKQFSEDARTEQGLIRELQLLRSTNNQLEKEKAELAHQVENYKHRIHTYTSEGPAAGHNEIVEKDKNDKGMTDVADLQAQLKASELEKQQLKEETKKLRRELENFNPSFFEEIEDLKYNYNEEVKKNIILEERLKQLSEEFGIHMDSPVNVSID
ncbi:centrosomal protein of 290 kDa [Mergus octosetaceus]